MDGYDPSLRGRERVSGVQGVFIILPAEDVDAVHDQLERWFSERQEVVIVDFGDMDKLPAFGYIMIEWYGYTIDQLFLTILTQGDPIECENFTIYMRGE